MNAIDTTDSRRMLRHDFARRCGLAGWSEHLLAGDASFRKYWRWSGAAGTYVVMDAPPPREDVRRFVRIARHLVQLGLSAPEVHAEDAEHGFLLLEDLGDDTYGHTLARNLAAGSGGDEPALYALAAEALVYLHDTGPAALLPDLPHYLGARMAEIATTLVDWYVPLALGRAATPAERAAYVEAWLAVLPHLDRLPCTLTLRDFHIDNLMWLPQRRGARACGLLDIQDAEIGVAPYDLASLVEDARRDIAPELRAATLSHYVERRPPADRDAFDVALAVCAAQRHSRIIGVFTRLDRRDGKPHYLKHLPRIWAQFDRALAHDALAPVRHWIDEHLPASRRWFAAA